ncbi:hypothetical protein [Legionella shakespearei]|uniref:Uncharacterized protein n=1 Tax=Legionella shakespearei DSM 23087 TaxID=1122169 RepID=A0A0W0YL34_9GAMM|nr:hypothetical protein [Legionella shakespearei]KTD57597.1 hypothetical protein Lsha_2438 [Legionella shakespearei DSM 23087]
MSRDKIEGIVNTFSPELKPDSILPSLRLKRREIAVLVDGLVPTADEPVCYINNQDKAIKVTILRLDNGSYFAKLHPAALAGVEDKTSYIKEAVQFALKEKNIALKFEDIAIGGVIGAEGRKAVIYNLFGQPPRSEHAYAVFKLPGEAGVHIEDPRMGFFNFSDKLQSKLDDQICCFAATALFYFCYKAFSEHQEIPCSSSQMFATIHACSALKRKMLELEEKVGYSAETKEEVMASFIKDMSVFENPMNRIPAGFNPR